MKFLLQFNILAGPCQIVRAILPESHSKLFHFCESLHGIFEEAQIQQDHHPVGVHQEEQVNHGSELGNVVEGEHVDDSDEETGNLFAPVEKERGSVLECLTASVRFVVFVGVPGLFHVRAKTFEYA